MHKVNDAASCKLGFQMPWVRALQVQETRMPLSPRTPSHTSVPAGSQHASKPAPSTSGYESAGDTLSSRSEPLCSERPSWGPSGRGGSSSVTGSALDGFNDASTLPDSHYESGSSSSSGDPEGSAYRYVGNIMWTGKQVCLRAGLVALDRESSNRLTMWKGACSEGIQFACWAGNNFGVA